MGNVTLTAPLADQSLPLDVALLRKLIGRNWRPYEHKARPRRYVTRVLMLCDPELLAMAVAVNRGLADGSSVASITARMIDRGRGVKIDENVVREFIRAIGLEVRVKRHSGFGKYHAKKIAESALLGGSAYTHRRGPARRSVADVVDEMDEDINDYIRGQGAF